MQLNRTDHQHVVLPATAGWPTGGHRPPATRWPGPASGWPLILLLRVNLFAGSALRDAKADLTQQHLFTISDGTRTMLRTIDEPISLRLYFSKRLGEAAPVLRALFRARARAAQQYSDISRRQAAKSPSSIPSRSPTPRTARWPPACGAFASTRKARSGYFGLVGNNSTDNDATIPFFTTDREPFLEYDVTKLIFTLANPKKRVVGLITGLPLDGGPQSDGHDGRPRPQPPQMVMEQIREFFDVKTLDQDVKEIPADIDVLMVAQPDKLTPEAAYAIDQFALGGGKVLAFVDPVAEMGGMGPMGDGHGAARATPSSSSC